MKIYYETLIFMTVFLIKNVIVFYSKILFIKLFSLSSELNILSLPFCGTIKLGWTHASTLETL